MELDTQYGLIRSSAVDMAMLPKIILHDAFANKKKDRRDSSNGHEGPRTMASWVSTVKMQQVRESCQVAYSESDLGLTGASCAWRRRAVQCL